MTGTLKAAAVRANATALFTIICRGMDSTPNPRPAWKSTSKITHSSGFNGKAQPASPAMLQRLTENAPFHTELHKLRKTWATRLAVNGMPLHILQRMLGRKSPATTQKYLADVDLSGGKLNGAIEASTYASQLKVIKSGTDGD